MPQTSLDFGRLYKVDESERAMYRALNDSVDVIGIVVAAGACGVDRADIRRSLDHKNRYVAVEHAMAIAAVVRGTSSELASAICGAFVTPSDFAIAEPRPLTDRERADRLEAMVRSMPLGSELVAKALKP